MRRQIIGNIISGAVAGLFGPFLLFWFVQGYELWIGLVVLFGLMAVGWLLTEPKEALVVFFGAGITLGVLAWMTPTHHTGAIVLLTLVCALGIGRLFVGAVAWKKAKE